LNPKLKISFRGKKTPTGAMIL